MIEFQAWPKTPRLFRDIVITEKIDGTNAAVVIEELGTGDFEPIPDVVVSQPRVNGVRYAVGAQSRKRLLTLEQDNFGFAGWVHDNATALVKFLGPGRHFGEWWGHGIQRGYGLAKGERGFSLFNVALHRDIGSRSDYLLHSVPVLYEGEFTQYAIEGALDDLRLNGSLAATVDGRGYGNPEGIIMYHSASNSTFKVLLDRDDTPKSLA